MIEPRLLRITKHQIETDQWSFKNDLKIVVLSDFHILWPWMTVSRTNKIIQQANALNPDIIMLLGDFKGDSFFGLQVNPDKACKAFEALEAKLGVYGVLGNHDLRSDHAWPAALAKIDKVKILRGEIASIKTPEGPLYVAGIDDLYTNGDDIPKTLEAAEQHKPIIFLSHNPDVFPRVPNNVALTLSGHTHAGQIRFPIIGSIAAVIPSHFGKRYEYGHIQEDGKNLFVTAGLGMTTLPVRFMNKPEIALLTLKKS